MQSLVGLNQLIDQILKATTTNAIENERLVKACVRIKAILSSDWIWQQFLTEFPTLYLSLTDANSSLSNGEIPNQETVNYLENAASRAESITKDLISRAFNQASTERVDKKNSIIH